MFYSHFIAYYPQILGKSHKLKRYDDAMKCVDFILNNNEDFENSIATETALEIRKSVLEL